MKLATLTSALLGTAVAAASSVASAAPPVVTTAAGTTPFSVSGTDLLQTALDGAPVLTGQFGSFHGGGTFEHLLRDGLGGAAGATDPSGYVAISTDSSVTYTLDLAASPAGYNLTAIDTSAAWDEGRDRQSVAISYATLADPGTFVALTSYSFDPPAGESFTRVSVTPGAGDAFLAEGVYAIRFNFPLQENSAGAYREIDVFGVSAVPEPSTWALMLGGAALLAWRRRAAPMTPVRAA